MLCHKNHWQFSHHQPATMKQSKQNSLKNPSDLGIVII